MKKTVITAMNSSVLFLLRVALCLFLIHVIVILIFQYRDNINASKNKQEYILWYRRCEVWKSEV